MKTSAMTIAALVVGSHALLACRDRAEQTEDGAARARPEAVETSPEVAEQQEPLVEYTYADRADFRSAKERQLVELDLRIGELEAQAQEATGDVERELDATVEDLKARREQVRSELDRFENVTEAEWESFRDTVDDAMSGLRDGLRSAWDRFKRST